MNETASKRQKTKKQELDTEHAPIERAFIVMTFSKEY